MIKTRESRVQHTVSIRCTLSDSVPVPIKVPISIMLYLHPNLTLPFVAVPIIELPISIMLYLHPNHVLSTFA